MGDHTGRPRDEKLSAGEDGYNGKRRPWKDKNREETVGSRAEARHFLYEDCRYLQNA